MVFVPLDFGMDLHCEAVVVTCIDYRFQRLFERWLRENLDSKYYNRVAYAGAVKNWDIIYPQIEFSERVHHVQRVILISHEDCRAYGEATKEQQFADLLRSREKILEKSPALNVELYYARLAGFLEKVT